MQQIELLIRDGQYERAYGLLLPIVTKYRDTPLQMPVEVRTMLANLIQADIDAGNISAK